MGRLAATALRLLAPRATGGVNTASGDDIANLVTTPLPEHTMVWAGGTLLQLDKDDATTPALQVGNEPVVVIPNSGGGRWKAIGGDALAAASQMTVATVLNQTIVTSGANEWSIMPVAAAFAGSASRWFSAGNGSGVITYNGPNGRFLVTVNLSVVNSQANLTQCGAVWSINGGFIGATTTVGFSGTQNIDNAGVQQVTAMGIADLANGNTLQPLFRSANGDDFVLATGSMSAAYLGAT